MDNVLILTGTVDKVYEKRRITTLNGSWVVHEFLLRYQDNKMYSKFVLMVIYGEERIRKFPVKKGDVVRVTFNVVSRECGSMYYTNCMVWNITYTRLYEEEVEKAKIQKAEELIAKSNQEEEDKKKHKKKSILDDLPF